eukprot:scaffold58785_cov19-Tisochrysis_lutea.AAC.3
MAAGALDSAELLRDHIVVTLFLTMLVGAGGNAGNQSAIKVIRGLVSAVQKGMQSVRKEVPLHRALCCCYCREGAACLDKGSSASHPLLLLLYRGCRVPWQHGHHSCEDVPTLVALLSASESSLTTRLVPNFACVVFASSSWVDCSQCRAAMLNPSQAMVRRGHSGRKCYCQWLIVSFSHYVDGV